MRVSRLADALLVALAAAPATAGPRMSGAEIEAALAGVTLDGIYFGGDYFSEAYHDDGTIRYWEKARAAGLPVRADFAEFWRDVEWMGLQRHLKVLGIFARLWHRDGKAAYIGDAPRFLGYVRHAVKRYNDLAPLGRLLDDVERRALEARPAG